MKRFATYILLTIPLSPLCSFAQDVAIGNQKLSTAAVRAEWSKAEDQVNGSISMEKLMKMKEATSALVSLLEDSCPGAAAYGPTWHGEYNSDKNSPGAQLKFGVICHFAAQNADLSITANDLQPLLDQLVVNGQHFLTMRMGSAADDQTKMWLVTAKNGMLPYTPVSRKEYLMQAKAELLAMVRSIEAGWKLKIPVRTAAAQDAERKAVIDQLKSMYTGTDLEIRARVYMRSYKTDEEFLKTNIAAETAGFRVTIRRMDSLMAHLGAAELSKGAVVTVGAADFRGFEDGQSNYMLIRMNEAYFNKTIGDEKPQLFLVTWHCEGKDTGAEELGRQLTEKLDGRVMQEMLNQ